MATYTLECSSDCNSEGESSSSIHIHIAGMSLITLNHLVFVLSPMNDIRQPSATLRLVVTISGNVAHTSQHAQVRSNQTPEPKSSSLVLLATSSKQPDLEAKAEADNKNASASLSQVDPRLAQRIDQLPSAQVPGTTDGVAGLSSILSNLEGFVKIGDLLADVRLIYIFLPLSSTRQLTFRPRL